MVSWIFIVRAVSKDVGVPAHHLSDDPTRHRVERETPVICADLSDQKEHKQDVPELSLQSIFTRITLHGVQQLIDLFQQVGSHTLEGLVFVPRAALRASQVSDTHDEFDKRWAILAHGWLQSGRKGL